MTKSLTGAVVVAALTAGLLVMYEKPATAQRPDIMTLVGPGSAIGVTVRETTADDAKAAGLDGPSGVVIASVRTGTPAEKAGFRGGDIVVEFDGERVRSVPQFTRLVRETPPRRTVRATVVRGTARQTLEVVPEVTGVRTDVRERLQGGRYLLRDFNFNVAPELRRRGLVRGPALGVTITPLTSQLADYFGVKEGALVSAVESGSAAAEAGVRAGDVITAVGGRSVRTAADIAEEVRRAQPGGSLDISVTRDRTSLLLKAVIPAAPARPSGRLGVSL